MSPPALPPESRHYRYTRERMSTPGLDSPTSPTSPGYTMSPTTPVDGPFASTLNHKHDDLSEESIKALNRHKLTRELSEQVFSRWKTDTDVTKRFVEEINKITELDKSVSSCCSSAHSRNPSEDLGAAGDDVMDDGPFQNQAKVPSDIESSPSKRKSGLKIIIPVKHTTPTTPKDAYDKPHASSPIGLGIDQLDGQLVADSIGFHHHHNHGYCHDIPAMSNDAANQLSPEAIEQILDGLLTHHQTEYDYERENIELKEKLETMSRQNSVSRRKYDRSDIRSTSPENVTPEARLNSSYRERGCGRGCGHAKGPQRSESYPQRNRSYGPEAKDTSGTSSGNASGTNTTRSPTSGHSSGRVQYAGSPENSTGMASGSSPISPSFDGFKPNDLIRGITDRLIEVGFHKRTRSSSGPPIMQRANVLERGSAFSTEPTSVPSFVCIFTVYIPEDHYGAPLTSIGRPLVPEGITTDRFTVIATYHPSYRHFVMDILDYCRCPVGFESNQLVDLMYLQNMGFLPLYIVYPRQPQTSYRYQVVQQWSICTLSASGEDVLWASNVDVMVQRIAGCMHRASESRSMSKTGHRRYLDSIASGCEDVCDVELYSKVAKMSSVPMAASVSLDYNENATLEWVPLHASPERQLPHARNCIPILRF